MRSVARFALGAGSGRRTKSYLLWVLLVVCYAMTANTAGANASPPTLVDQRGGNAPTVVRGSYDYAPSLMRDGKYKMWWCGGVSGDHVLYSEATALLGPWSTPKSVFQPTVGNTNTFDDIHTCDPSVIRVDGVYYMYYGGGINSTSAALTQIGVANSRDGITWRRLNEGRAIIGPQVANATSIYKGNDNPCDDGRNYGAGQPSATHVDGYFYLIYTDTTGNASDACSGAGQYVVRSRDPAFRSGVEVLTANGFTARTDSNKTAYSLPEAFSLDWMYSDILDSFVLAGNSVLDRTTVHLYDRGLTRRTDEFYISAQWTEGPGLVRRPDGHAPPSPRSLSRVPLDIFRLSGPSAP